MPCRDYDEVPYSNDLEEKVEQLKCKLDNVTDLLCTLLSHKPELIVNSDKLTKWWEEHQEADRQRLLAEKKEQERFAEQQKRQRELNKQRKKEKEERELKEYNRLKAKYEKETK